MSRHHTQQGQWKAIGDVEMNNEVREVTYGGAVRHFLRGFRGELRKLVNRELESIVQTEGVDNPTVDHVTRAIGRATDIHFNALNCEPDFEALASAEEDLYNGRSYSIKEAISELQGEAI